jgi:hypothetical protein
LLEHLTGRCLTTLLKFWSRPDDYHLFTFLKNWLGSQRFSNNEELMEGVKMWLSSQAADFFNTGIQKLVPRYKCLISGGECVGK